MATKPQETNMDKPEKKPVPVRPTTQSQIANFEYIARLKFASKLRYMTDHKASDVMLPNYFKNSMNNYLEAGDEIDVVCRHDDGTWTKFQVEVVKKTATDIEVAYLTKPRTVGGSAPRNMTKHYIPSTATWMVKADGEVVAKDLTKEEALALVADEGQAAA